MDFDTVLMYASLCVEVYEQPMTSRNKGLYMDGIVWLNKGLTSVDKACVLAEELGHHNTSVGNILDQSLIQNRKQEQLARQWAYEFMIPLEMIVQAYHSHIQDRYQLAEFLGVTEEFLQATIDRYTEKYGLFAQVNERYTVCFNPLGVIEIV
ncbi:ImmA/IrrE family metallo-endopeptidase [Paenibacillus sp. RC84]|uniref:ImmA/IrrE family metallo-endopeptidase n=1 Tax=Paenibacillus sp. RC84 TaxID=3156252 RepID=UPI00351736AB